MKFDIGTVIAVAAALIFYLRLIVLQRQKVKRMRLIQTQAGKGKTKDRAQEPARQQPGFEIASWRLVAAGIVLIVAGALVSYVDWFGAEARSLWWIPITLGILLLGFSVR